MWRAILLVSQLALAVGCGYELRLFSSHCDDPSMVLLFAAVVSFACPRRFMWMALASWAVFWGLWSAWEFDLWRNDANKFGEGCYVYGFAALLFGIASAIKFRSSPPGDRSRVLPQA